MLTFAGNPFPGFHERVMADKPMLQTKRTKFAGILGESEIRLGAGGRQLSCRVWLNSPAYGSAAAVANAMGVLDAAVGTNGDLVETGAISQTWPDCTFEGFVPSSSILPAVGSGMPQGSYFVEGELFWYQLRIT